MCKKSLLFMLLFALIAPWAANAQNQLNEGFEGTTFPPEDWTAIHVSGTQAWTRGTGTGNNSSSAYAYRKDVSGGYEDYLITPQLVPATGEELSFYLASQYSANYAGTTLTIEVSTTTPEIASFTNVIATYTSGASGTFGTSSSSDWVNKTVDVSAYVGQQIYIAFHAKDTGYNADVRIDDVTGVSVYVPACPKPTGLALATDGETVTATWAGSASSYNIDVNGSVTPGVTSPYTFRAEFSTTYTVKVQANCGTNGTSEWTNPVSITTPACVGGHTIEYTLTDSFGDGWNGASITLTAGCEDPTTLTLSSGYSTSGTLTICEDYFTFIWKSGSYDSECGFTFTENGTTLFTKPSSLSNGQVLYTFGTTTPKPTDLTAGHLATTSAVLSWEENGNAEAWQICVNGDETNLIDVTENPYTLTGLTQGTSYTVKVRAYVDATTQSCWSDEVTFTTEAACPAPTNVAVSDITATSATVSWTGEASSYNLRYREMTAEDFATITLYAEDVWQDGTGYQMLLDADATAYGTIIPTSGGLTSGGNASAATYAEFEYKIPVNADGAMNTTNVVIAESITIQVPAGTYDWCVTNPTPGDRIWIASDNGNVGGRYDDYEFRGGNTYYFHVYKSGSNDAVDVTVTEPGSAKDVVWTEINNVTSPYTISVDPEKDYIVEVQANCGEYLSSWVGTNFSTPSNCQVPTPLDVTDITASTATLNWTGLQDSYQVQYRTKGSRELLFSESFDSQPSTWTLTNTAYSTTSSATTDYLVFIGSGSTETAYLITPELTDFENGGGTVEFMQRVYNGEGETTFQVGFSSTTNDVDAFTWGEEVAAAPIMFTAYSVAMPAGTKYVAIKSTTSTTDCSVLINDFGIYGNEIPAGQWNTATANTTSCPISGLEANTEYEWQVRGVNESCGGYTEWCDLVTFTTEVSCPVPTNVTVSDVTGESAVIAWTSDASLFDIDVNGVVTNGVTNPYTLENLDPATIYSVKVRANCGDGDYSDWTESIAFVTDCGGAKDVPYTYGFEDLGEYYACWGTYADADNENSLGISSYDGAYDGSNVFVFSSYTNYGTDYDQYLFLPELNVEGEATLEFYYRTLNGYGSGETFEVGYSADDEVYTWSDEISTTTTEWTLYTDVLPAGTKYVVIHYYSDYQYYLLVDGFSITAAPVIGQTIELAAGWNWFSTYIDMDPVELLEMFEEGLGEDAIQIKSKTKATAWDEDEEEWSGGLQTTGLTNDLTYMVQLPANTTLTVTLVGPAVATESCTINLQPGWNWIGFPSAVAMDVNEALADFEAMDGDQLKSRNQATAWDEDEEEWSGSLNTLVPGQGLMFYSAATDEVRTLVFNAGSSKGKAATQNGNSNLLNHTKMVKKNNTVSRIISMNNTKMEKNELQKLQDNYKRSNNPL